MGKGPNIDCPSCLGEGVDLDVYGNFDYDCIGPCQDCWPKESNTHVTPSADDVFAEWVDGI